MTPIEAITTLTTGPDAFTMQDLSEALGVSRAYLYQVKSGKEKGYTIGKTLEGFITGGSRNMSGTPTSNDTQEEEETNTSGSIAWGSICLGIIIGGLLVGVYFRLSQAPTKTTETTETTENTTIPVA
jgi:hypothetical protein